MSLLTRSLMQQIFRFACVGGLVMLSFVGLNALFGRWFSDQISFLLAYPPAVALHFLLNKWWTFEAGSGATAKQLREYIVMVAVTFVIQWSVFTGLQLTTNWPAWLLAGIANVVQMGVTFLVMQRRIFVKPKALRP